MQYKTIIEVCESTMRVELSERDVRVVERMYLEVWKEKGTVGGPRVWAEVIIRFLSYKGYSITKEEE